MNLKRRTGCWSIGMTALAASVPCTAAEIPTLTMHSSQLQTSFNNCLGRADKAFFDVRVQNVRKGVRERLGDKNNVHILVICTPGSDKTSYLIVVASSNDSNAAIRLKDDINARINRMREF